MAKLYDEKLNISYKISTFGILKGTSVRKCSNIIWHFARFFVPLHP